MCEKEVIDIFKCIISWIMLWFCNNWYLNVDKKKKLNDK